MLLCLPLINDLIKDSMLLQSSCLWTWAFFQEVFPSPSYISGFNVINSFYYSSVFQRKSNDNCHWFQWQLLCPSPLKSSSVSGWLLGSPDLNSSVWEELWCSSLLESFLLNGFFFFPLSLISPVVTSGYESGFLTQRMKTANSNANSIWN